MLGQRGESETELFHHPHRQHQQLQQESASSSYTASPAHRARPQPEYKVVNVKEPPLIRDSSFNSIHTSVEIVVVVSLVSRHTFVKMSNTRYNVCMLISEVMQLADRDAVVR